MLDRETVLKIVDLVFPKQEEMPTPESDAVANVEVDNNAETTEAVVEAVVEAVAENSVTEAEENQKTEEVAEATPQLSKMEVLMNKLKGSEE